jgi:membrane fusion protein, multidrug efflux system
MGHLKSADLEERRAAGEDFEPLEQGASRGSWWVWLVLLAIVAGVGFWFYRSVRSSTQAQGGAGVPGAGPGGAPGQGLGPMIVPVVVATATRGALPVYFNGLGTVTAFNTVTVRSRVDGQIVKINFVEGQMVHEGDALIEIDPRPYQVMLEQAEGSLAKDQAQLRDVQVDYDRYQLLFKEGVIPKQQLDTQQAQVGQFEGSIKADQGAIDNAKLQIAYSHITAPISGRVGLRLVDMGNIVHASDTTGLVVITQLQPIAVIFSLPQDQLSQVMSKLSGNQLAVEAYDRDDTTKVASGKLLTIDNQIDTTTGTYKLKAVFDNEKNNLFPNQFVNVHLLVDTKRNSIIVPSTAIQHGPQGTYVYLAKKDNTVTIRPVSVALSSSGFVGINSGLQPGESVVVDGQDKLQEGTQIEAHAPAGNSGLMNTQGPQIQGSSQTQARSSPQSTSATSQRADKGKRQ